MKAYKTVAVICFTLCFAVGFHAHAQDKEAERVAMEQAVLNENYIFRAQTVTPIGGTFRQLTSEYDLRVTPDSLVCFLPYFGQVFATAPYDARQTGVKFTSKRFTHTLVEKKKGRKEITIDPKDLRDTEKMILTIRGDGFATLQVTSIHRQPISYDGVIVVPGAK